MKGQGSSLLTLSSPSGSPSAPASSPRGGPLSWHNVLLVLPFLVEVMLSGAGSCALSNSVMLQLPSEGQPRSEFTSLAKTGARRTREISVKSPNKVVRRESSCRTRSQGSPLKRAGHSFYPNRFTRDMCAGNRFSSGNSSWVVVKAKENHEPLERNLAVSWEITLEDGPKHSPGAIHSLGASQAGLLRAGETAWGNTSTSTVCSALSIRVSLCCCWRQGLS